MSKRLHWPVSRAIFNETKLSIGLRVKMIFAQLGSLNSALNILGSWLWKYRNSCISVRFFLISRSSETGFLSRSAPQQRSFLPLIFFFRLADAWLHRRILYPTKGVFELAGKDLVLFLRLIFTKKSIKSKFYLNLSILGLVKACRSQTPCLYTHGADLRSYANI